MELRQAFLEKGKSSSQDCAAALENRRHKHLRKGEAARGCSREAFELSPQLSKNLISSLLETYGLESLSADVG